MGIESLEKSSGDASSDGQVLADDLLQQLADDVVLESTTRGNNTWNDASALERAAARSYEARDGHFEVQAKAEVFSELIGDRADLSDGARAYLDNGGSIESLLAELRDYREKGLEKEKVSAVDSNIRIAREHLVELTANRSILHPREHREDLAKAETDYQQACLSKIRQLFATDSNDREASLSAGHLPQIVEKLSFTDGEAISLEDLAGSHMHVLVDLLCREELKRDQALAEKSSPAVKRIVTLFQNNKSAKAVVAGGFLAAGLLGLAGSRIGDNASELVHHIQTGLVYLGTYLTGRKLLEGGAETIQEAGERRKNKQKVRELASDEELTTLTLRAAYNYEESIHMSDRKGDPDTEENMRRLGNLNPDFRELETAPENYQYKGERVLPYIYDILVNKRDLVESIAKGDNPEQTYYQLAELLIKQDIDVLRKDMITKKAIKWVCRGLSASMSFIVGQFISKLGDTKEYTATSLEMMSEGSEGATLPKSLASLIKTVAD